MELSLTFRSWSPFVPRKLNSPSSHPPKLSIPTISPTPALPLQRTPRPTVAAAAGKKEIEGVSEELNLIASQNLDYAAARRRVRSAFIQVQQQLDHCLFKVASAGVRTEEWIERNSKGLEIFFRSWMPEPGVKTKGAVCFCHGYGDTCTFFFEGIARFIAASGYGVYAIDHPGFGLSEGLHGYIYSFDELADNVIEQYAKIKERPESRGLPFFILGQSMGGAVTLKVHLKDPQGWDGIILVAPMCKAVYNVICYNDPVRLRTAVELLKATKEIEMQVEKVSSPLLILHGAADKVTDPLISQFLYENASSKDKTLKLYEEGYHSILEGEPDDRIFTVLNDIIAWLDARC
ncbi:PREDICTED: caffeoylshikimate esterase isoform X2 [Theobroma cacao]|uniref:Caffeoylshikimate esterase isoform X2 n=2 Tax=Theobroma cacao TaxID=3641 RepID=A0AB32VIS8_THECC|nr:PREDICTED: caffeoylshikimate esterase isoform X2 [Theobroma cacao]EOY00153.1 Alpha/beta-Hydrolases superfamily protein isoform 4 [Theobroma cacao]